MFDYITSQSRYIYIVQLNIQYEVLLQLQLRSSLERAKIHSVVSLQYIKRCLAVAYRSVRRARLGYAIAQRPRAAWRDISRTHTEVLFSICSVVQQQNSYTQCRTPLLWLRLPALGAPPTRSWCSLPPLHTARTPTASLLRTKTVILTRNTQRILLRRPTPIDRKYADETTMYSNKTQFQFQDPFLGIRRSFFDLVGVG